MTKTVLLGDVVDTIIDYRGKTPKKLGGNWSESGYRALSAKNIENGRLKNPESIRFVDPDLYKKWMKEEVRRGDILLTSEGPMGESMLWDSDEKIVLSQRLFGIRPDTKVMDSNFLYAYISSPVFKAELEARASGSTVRGIRQAELRKTKINLPDTTTQKFTGQFINQLNQKIELNRRMNETLEKIGQALFEHYFIDTPEAKTWQVGSLANYGSFKNGVNYGREDVGDADFKIVNVRNLSNDEFVTAQSLDNLKINESKALQYELSKNDILIVRSAAPGNVAILDEGKAIYSGFIIRFRVHEIWNRLFAFYLLKFMKPQLLGHSDGTTLKNINQESLKSFKINIPTESKIKEFNEQITPIVTRIFNNMHELENLVKLRDSLLPRLISGKMKA